ncbi:MAG: hypothetical protein LIP77_12200, partial [Planctomycetes bacterium]|nr:hypothetical protein [Planctomycetota bacterium]
SFTKNLTRPIVANLIGVFIALRNELRAHIRSKEAAALPHYSGDAEPALFPEYPFTMVRRRRP